MRSWRKRSSLVIRGSVRTRILRIRRIFADWLVVVPTDFSSLIKVFWKGEFEGKNLFFKKGFPLLWLEKTSLKGSQLAGDRKFFQADGSPPKKLAAKIAKNA